MAEKAAGRTRNIVVVGDKPTMNYVVACLTLFNSGFSDIRVRARGRNISRAVDVVEMMRRVFIKGLVVANVDIGTDHLTGSNGESASVSAIEIKLVKPSAQDLSSVF